MKAAKTLEGLKQLTLLWFDVSDLHKSVHFYREMVRLKLLFLDEEAGWASFDTGAVGVELGLTVRPVGGTPGRGGGGCPVFEVEDIQQTRDALEARGVKFDGGVVGEAGTRRHCTFHDPDGNALQISQVWS